MMKLKLLCITDLKGMVGGDVTKEEFLSIYRISSETVGPTIAADIKTRAVWAVDSGTHNDVPLYFHAVQELAVWSWCRCFNLLMIQ